MHVGAQGRQELEGQLAHNAVQVFYFINQLPRPPGRGRRSASPTRPATSSTAAPAGGDDPVLAQTRSTARHRRRAARPEPHRQREHVDAARRHAADDADVPVRHAAVRFGRAIRPAGQRRRRRRGRLPRVHARPVEPAGGRRRRQQRARQPAGRRDGRGLERLVRDGLPERAGLRAGHRRRRATSCIGDYVERVAHLLARSRWTARSAPRTPRCPGGRDAAPAATPTATSARSTRRPGGARRRRDLGARPCGTCATRSARTRRRERWSPRGWSCRRRARRSSTCATRSCRPTVVENGGANGDTIWQVFAHRGMGYFASSVGGDDPQPVEDFSVPPDCSAHPSTRSPAP